MQVRLKALLIYHLTGEVDKVKEGRIPILEDFF